MDYTGLCAVVSHTFVTTTYPTAQQTVGRKKGILSMRRKLSASVWREGNWYIAQCMDVDVASQGETEETALENLRDALELHFTAPIATIAPHVCTIEIEVAA